MALPGQSPSWFRTHFNDDYLTIYSGRDAAQADAEVETVVRELSITPDDLVLDLCCGFGRHIAAFARRRVRAVGIDLSLPLLRRVAPTVPRDYRRAVCADMRSLPFSPGGVFSVVVNFFTSFGYFATDAENSRALREIERVLRPGGRFSIDLLNAQTAVKQLSPFSEREAGPFLVREERSFSSLRSRIEKEITLTLRESGETRRYHESVRIFGQDEFRALVEEAGLRVRKTLGDFSGVPFGDGTARMVVLGEKP